MKRQIHRIYRRTWVGFASIGLLLLGAGLSGCGESDTSVADILSPGATAADGGSAANLNFDEILDVLELSDEQRSGVEAAIASFRESQSPERGPRGGRRGGSRVERSGDDFAERAAARGEAVMSLVGAVGEILTPAQTAVFVEYLKEKREEMRSQHEARMNGRGRDGRDGRPGRPGHPGDRGDRGPLSELDLTESQKESVHSAMTTMRAGVREIMERVREGTTSIDDAIVQASTLAQTLKSELAGILTEEQMSTLEEWKASKVEKMVRFRLGRLSEAMERRVVFLTRVLHLDDAQTATVSDFVLETVPAREALLEQLLAGTLDRATMGLEVLRIERTLQESIAGVLTAEQQAAFAAILELLPGHRPHPMTR